MLPLTIFFLLVAIVMLAWKAGQRRGFRPFFLGTVGAVAIVVGKFYLENDFTGYAGIALLVAASVWNAWPREGADAGRGVQLEPYNMLNKKIKNKR